MKSGFGSDYESRDSVSKKKRSSSRVNTTLVKKANEEFQSDLNLLSTESNILNLDFNKPNTLLGTLSSNPIDKKTKKAVSGLAASYSPLFLKRSEMIRQRSVSPGRSQTLLTGRRTLLG